MSESTTSELCVSKVAGSRPAGNCKDARRPGAMIEWLSALLGVGPGVGAFASSPDRVPYE